jgi:hypothetical protein
MCPFKNKSREEQFNNMWEDYKQKQKEEEDKLEALEQNQIFSSIKQLVELYQFRAGQTEWSQAIEEHICSKLDTLKNQSYKDQLIELITMKSRVYGVRPMNIGDGEAYKQWVIQHKLKELEGDFEDAR